MKIRKASSKDFNILKELKSKHFLEECKHDSRFDSNYVNKGLGIRLSKNLKQKNCVFFIAEESNNVFGFVGAEILKNETCMNPKFSGSLFALYVKPEHRRKGVASILLKQVFTWFEEKKVNNLVLETHTSNTNAQKLYKKFGYKEVVKRMVRKL